MRFVECLLSVPAMLTQGSVHDRLRRTLSAADDPEIGLSGAIYDPEGRRALGELHATYISIARRAKLPMLSMASTWRVDQDRLARSRFADRDVNGDQIRFLREIAAEIPGESPVFLAGVLGPKNDAYDPEAALASTEARAFHAPQAEAIASAGPDCLIALTLPSVEEAQGLAQAMEATGLPYLLSFVLGADGRVLDGTPLPVAFGCLDRTTQRPPVGYLINCSHPRALRAAYTELRGDPELRLLGLRANASPLPVRWLDGSAECHAQTPAVLCEEILEVREALGLTLLGGCCGTGPEHLELLSGKLGEPR